MLGLAMAVPLLVLGCWHVFQAYRSASWPATDGVVISAAIKHSNNRNHSGRGSSGKTVAAKIRYSYQVDGITYRNDTVRFGNVYMSDLFGVARATVKRHPPGPGTVYYNAQDPGVSVLEPGLHGSLFIPTGAGLLFTIISAAFILHGVRRK